MLVVLVLVLYDVVMTSAVQYRCMYWQTVHLSKEVVMKTCLDIHRIVIYCTYTLLMCLLMVPMDPQGHGEH